MLKTASSVGHRLAARALSGSGRRGTEHPHQGPDPHFKEKLAHTDLGKAETKPMGVDDFIHPPAPRADSISVAGDDSVDISGAPEYLRTARRARIFKPAREATQTAWNNTKLWKVELDNQERWENPNIGWASSADVMSSLSMHMKFARAEDAVRFCEKNGWDYDLCEPQERAIRPKNYGENYHWSKKTRIGCK